MEGSCTVFKKYDTPHKNQSQSLLEMMQKYLSGFWPRKCIVYTVYVKKPDMNRCIWSNHNKLSFYAEIQFFGGQWRKLIGKIQWRLIEGICKKKMKQWKGGSWDNETQKKMKSLKGGWWRGWKGGWWRGWKGGWWRGWKGGWRNVLLLDGGLLPSPHPHSSHPPLETGLKKILYTECSVQYSINSWEVLILTTGPPGTTGTRALD